MENLRKLNVRLDGHLPMNKVILMGAGRNLSAIGCPVVVITLQGKDGSLPL
jgi:hypothetical protein